MQHYTTTSRTVNIHQSAVRVEGGPIRAHHQHSHIPVESKLEGKVNKLCEFADITSKALNSFGLNLQQTTVEQFAQTVSTTRVEVSDINALQLRTVNTKASESD